MIRTVLISCLALCSGVLTKGDKAQVIGAQEIFPSHADTTRYFGYSVGMSNDGETVILGAPDIDRGRVVFLRKQASTGDFETESVFDFDDTRGANLLPSWVDMLGFTVAMNGAGTLAAATTSIPGTEKYCHVAFYSRSTTSSKFSPASADLEFPRECVNVISAKFFGNSSLVVHVTYLPEDAPNPGDNFPAFLVYGRVGGGYVDFALRDVLKPTASFEAAIFPHFFGYSHAMNPSETLFVACDMYSDYAYLFRKNATTNKFDFVQNLDLPARDGARTLSSDCGVGFLSEDAIVVGAYDRNTVAVYDFAPRTGLYVSSYEFKGQNGYGAKLATNERDLIVVRQKDGPAVDFIVRDKLGSRDSNGWTVVRKETLFMADEADLYRFALSVSHDDSITTVVGDHDNARVIIGLPSGVVLRPVTQAPTTAPSPSPTTAQPTVAVTKSPTSRPSTAAPSSDATPSPSTSAPSSSTPAPSSSTPAPSPSTPAPSSDPSSDPSSSPSSSEPFSTGMILGITLGVGSGVLAVVLALRAYRRRQSSAPYDSLGDGDPEKGRRRRRRDKRKNHT